MNKKLAFQEAFGDTMLALTINFPLNLLLVWFAYQASLTVFYTSLLLTTVFTTVAIIRKYYVRLWFESRNNKRLTNK